MHHVGDDGTTDPDGEVTQHLGSTLAFVRRREWLSKFKPVCPACGEDHQSQLFDWINKTAIWRCRSCRYRFEHEPSGP